MSDSIADDKSSADRHIVVLDAIGAPVADKLRALLPDGFSLSHATERTEDHLAAIIAEADFAVSGQVCLLYTSPSPRDA